MEAWINLGLLMMCITLALLAAGKYLAVERRLA
jgi:hypothetical protein